MPQLKLKEPNWSKLAGGTTEAAWIGDRDRKHGLATEYAARILSTFDELKKRGALYQANPEVLRSVPYSADWYVSLAGYAMKTLGQIRAKPAAFGLTRVARGVVECLRRGESIAPQHLVSFSNWINSELDVLLPAAQRDPRMALVIASQIFGGRIIGMGQNTGGDDAVTVLKTPLIGELAKVGPIEVRDDNGRWIGLQPGVNLAGTGHFRFAGRLLFEFVAGGNRPDMLVSREPPRPNGKSTVIAVGEIKGRKDLSNAWESWMPQVDAHMREWATSRPDAARLFFGTLITGEMIDGASAFRGIARPGFRDMYQRGDLTSAYNLSRLTDQDPSAVRSFAELIGELKRAAKN